MAENIAESEYSAQYFGFTPETFIEDFSEMVLAEMSSVVEQSIKEYSSPTCTLTNKETLIKNSVKIHDIWMDRAEGVLKKLQPAIKEFFTIPKNVLLPQDEVQAKQYSEEDVKKLDEEVKELQQKYLEELTLAKMYKREITMLEKLEPVQKKVNEAVNVLKRFGETCSEIKELGNLAQTYRDCRKVLFSKDNDDQDDSEENDDLIIHECKFKTA